MFYKIIVFFATIIMRIFYKVEFQGLENVPESGGYLLASNHRSNFDPVFLVVKLPHRMHFMAKEELFKFKPFGWAIKQLGAFPVSRGKADLSAIDTSVELLNSGKPILIFPEGTRSKTGKPLRPKSGTALVAGRAQIGVLPATIDFKGKLKFRTHVTVKYHPLLTPEELAIDTSVPSTMRSATRLIMDTIVSGLSYLPEEGDDSKI